MNSMDEQLWAYIDGTATPAEREEISRLIAEDEAYRQQYTELLALQTDLDKLELDEPSMAFTYNVMEQIRTEEALVPLKSVINKKIITGIAAFFVITITALLIFAMRQVHWSSAQVDIKIPDQVNHMQNLFTGQWMTGFMFFDVICGLFLLDSYLRKKNAVEQVS